jgi:YfiH family protein
VAHQVTRQEVHLLRPEAGGGGAAPGWSLENRNGLVLALCREIEAIEGIAHAFSTRRSDAGDFDTGGAGPVSDVVRERRRRLLEASGIDPSAAPVVLRQEHGVEVLRASEARSDAAGDAVVWLRAEGSNRSPSVRTADCVPILIVDVRGRAAAAVHAGWRGTEQGIAGRVVEALCAAGIDPTDLVVALGPAILRCCYEVETAVADRIVAACGGAQDLATPARTPGRALLDLHAANRAQLARAGCAPARIHAAPWCTKCRRDLFFSYRRDGTAAGRHMAVVGPAVATPRP